MEKITLKWSPLVHIPTDLQKIPSSGCVYRLSKKESDGKFYVFFVGSAENLKEALKINLSEDEKNEKLKLFLLQKADFAIKYAEVTNKELRVAIEKQLYKHYMPITNLAEPISLLEVEFNIN